MLPSATREKIIHKLLDYYEDELAQGRRLSPSQVCKDHPELFFDVAQQIQILESLEKFLASGRGSPYDTFIDEHRKLLLGYEVEERIGRGAFGLVYRARQTALSRCVAVKVVRTVDPRRIEKEARILAEIRSPNVVTIHDFRKLSEDLFVLVMELIDGGSLLDVIEASSGKIPEAQAVAWMNDVASGMLAVAERGITHRDLKPSNVLIGHDRRAKVGDFGLAIGTSPSFATSHAGAAGTPPYMAPEQFANASEVDTRADIYSFGATFYHALVGQPPFDANDVATFAQKHVYEPLIPPVERNRSLSESTSRFLEKCLAKAPDDRFQSFQNVIECLDGHSPFGLLRPPDVPLWVYKCNATSSAEGEWDYFFDDVGGEGEWGGTWCINNHASRKIIRERLQVGDLVLAWQTDKQAAYGLCRVAALEDHGDDTGIILETLMRFAQPVKLLEWKERSPALADGKAFRKGNAGTIFETTPAEATEILRICEVDLAVLRRPNRDRKVSKTSARNWWVFAIDGRAWLSKPPTKGDVGSWVCNDKAKRGDFGLIYAKKPVSALVGVVVTTSKVSFNEDAGRPFVCDIKCRVIFRNHLTLNEMNKDPGLRSEPLIQQEFEASFGPPLVEKATLNRLAAKIPELARLLARGSK